VFYVKTAPDGTLEQYPYTLTDLRCENKNTSWPQNISDELAAEFGVFLVSPTPQPADRYNINLRRTASKQGANWVEQWVETPATPEQITERTAAKESEVRQQRIMAVRSKTGTAPLQHQPGKPKLTRQGNGARSKPSHGRKLCAAKVAKI
jgi:hypothetical protein